MFKNRIRLPFFLSKPQFPVERNVFRKADGSSQLLSAIIRNTYEGKTDQLPEDWHRKLIIALAHDEVTIEDNRLLTDVVLDGDYEIDWQDFLNYPIAGASFKIQTTPFNATNNNCQSCAEITQMNLADDYLGGTLEQGNSYSTPSILDNDYICCFPFTVEIMTFNTTYFDYVTYDGDGVLSITVKASVPTLPFVFVATYRVTCPNGDYDEANVYANIEGTSTECVPVSGPHFESDPPDGSSTATVLWNRFETPTDGYNWWLYECDDIYTILDSGTTMSNAVVLTGLEPGVCYVFAVQANCGGGNLSTLVSLEFTNPAPVDPNACGKYFVFNEAGGSGSYSYFDCEGAVQGRFIAGNSQQTQCMLMDPDTHIPVFFAASLGAIFYQYLEPC